MGVRRPANKASAAGFRAGEWILSAALFLGVLVSPAAAQDSPVPAAPDAAQADVPETDARLSTEGLPQPRNLAAALSDEDSRRDTLLTVIAVARLLDYGHRAAPERAGEIEARFRDERAWLDHLAGRYTELPSRPTLLDPSAWFLLHELGQQQIEPGPLSSPLGPASESLLREIFDRTDERLSAALLPELLPPMERLSVGLWRRLLDRLPTDPVLRDVVFALNADWFDPWAAAEPPAPTATGEALEPEAQVLQAADSLRVMVGAAMAAGPPDALRLKRLRFELLQALPGLQGAVAADASYLLALGSALDGLYRRDYMAFTSTLLWVASELLLDAPPAEDAYHPVVPRLLTDLLPALSNAYAGDFGEVDPRINASLAAVFDVMQYLQASAPDPSRRSALRSEIADAVAQLVLLIPDMDYYFDQPVRERIAEEIDICISIMADRNLEGGLNLSREQFDGCLESLVSMAGDQASRAELSGDPDGPFGAQQLRREMLLTPWQRINYTLGFLHEQHPTGCEPPPAPLPNPLEWSSLASVLVWFGEQAPLYMQSPANEALLLDMRRGGSDLLDALLRQVDCISGAGTGLNDPVVRGLADYRKAMDALIGGLREAELEFRETRLKPGSDVVLHGDASQQTAFRNEELEIGPCDTQRLCEMNGRLEATRALIGLFPEPYLIADQIGLGEIEICYDNVQWVDRRSAPVREGDSFVANYFGHLSFDLVGRYHEGADTTDVFGFNFVSPDEYHYLFAAATAEVLEDSCPVEWVGSRVVTGLGNEHAVRIVPDRLTYLAAARSLPSQVIAANWSRAEEWRDSFVTGRGVTAYSYEPDGGIEDRVNRRLQALYQAEQAMLYSALLRSPAGTRDVQNSLYELLEDVTVRKAMLRSYLVMFYPQFLLDASEIRGALEGHSSLLSRRVLQGFREANVAVSSINQLGLERLDRFQALWSRQPDAVRRSGSTAISMAHAVTRLDSLFYDLYVRPRSLPAPAEPAPLQPATDGPAAEEPVTAALGAGD